MKFSREDEVLLGQIVEVPIEDDSVDEAVGIDEYSISSYGADFDVEGILRRFRRGDIEIPEYQRKNVWTKTQESKFVESLLLGLPVPGIFLYREDDTRKLTVIDGQQRIRTLDKFCIDPSDSRDSLRLSGLETRFKDVIYKELNSEDRRKIDDSIIHATIIRQEKPEGDSSSKYSIFERLNTGGTRLSSQEVRSAIFQGAFCDMLNQLNENDSWRRLFGMPHKRKRDEELILRFFALFYEADKYFRPMARFLNNFMQKHQNISAQNQESMVGLFESTVSTIHNRIGVRAFKPQIAVNAAVMDAIMVGVARRLQNGEIKGSLIAKHDELLNNAEFIDSFSGGTSDTDKVIKRLKLGIDMFKDAK